MFLQVVQFISNFHHRCVSHRSKPLVDLPTWMHATMGNRKNMPIEFSQPLNEGSLFIYMVLNSKKFIWSNDYTT